MAHRARAVPRTSACQVLQLPRHAVGARGVVGFQNPEQPPARWGTGGASGVACGVDPARAQTDATRSKTVGLEAEKLKRISGDSANDSCQMPICDAGFVQVNSGN